MEIECVYLLHRFRSLLFSTSRHWRWARFNIYIYDYCVKRGYQKTARELLSEAEISPDAQPPINAKQGLLFECVHYLIRPTTQVLTLTQVVECLLGLVYGQK